MLDLAPVVPETTLQQNAEPTPAKPSTAGMTTKVVKGSLWTLAGQIAPVLISFFATPFIIRFLGSEQYGILILVGLIPTYFAFADLGMGVASTKFGSEAYCEGDTKKEAAIINTAALIALVCVTAVAIPLFIFSERVISEFNVPEHLATIASKGLKITAIAFVLGVLAQVYNSPQLARLRMDLNTANNALPKVLMAAATPFVLYLGGGVIEAVWVAFVATALILIANLVAANRLLPEVYRLLVLREYIRPLLVFGGGMLVATIAIILIGNLEKFLIARLISVQALAYYSVAYTLASMSTMLPIAMMQSLIPAFSQLLAPEKRCELAQLFSRSIRLNLIWLFPAIAFSFVVARPFLTIWAGEEFGRESTAPFYILLLGLFFNILAYVPYSALVAAGKTSLLAALYSIEFVVFAIAGYFLISRFGILGAAITWSCRVALEIGALAVVSRRLLSVEFGTASRAFRISVAAASLIPAVAFAAFVNNYSSWIMIILPSCGVAYFLLAWFAFLDANERKWLRSYASVWTHR